MGEFLPKTSGNKGKSAISSTPIMKKIRQLASKVPMNVKQRFSYVVIILFLASIYFVSQQSMSKLSDHLHIIGQNEIPKIELVGNIKEEVKSIYYYAAKYAFEQNTQDKTNIEKFIDLEVTSVRKNLKELKAITESNENNTEIETFSKDFEKYVAYIPTFYETAKSNDYDSIHSQMGLLTTLGSKSIISLDKLEKNVKNNTDSIIQTADKDTSSSEKQLLIVTIIAALFSILISVLMTRIIGRAVKRVVENVGITTNSVTEIKKSISHTANGAQTLDDSMNKATESVSELVASIHQVAGNTVTAAAGVDEISAAVEQMSASINIVAGSAGKLDASAEETSSAIQEMMASIEQVAGNAGNVSASVEQISAAIEQMSKSIISVNEHAIELTHTAEETSETVEEMVVSINQVAASAQTVNTLSGSVKKDALEGTVSLNDTLSSMLEISQVIDQASDVMINLGKSSEEIGGIIQVIEDIADQTDLLALNAAIEAARAGEQGKGFAVVADEVRRLAERSAKATKEIAILIHGIQQETTTAVASIQSGADKVRVGNQLADQTNEAIKKIAAGIEQVTVEMSQIAKATEEQTKNSSFIINAVENVTKQATEMTYSTKEQAITSDEILKGIISTRDQVQQITVATAEQAKGSHAIISAVENVTNQTNSVTSATKEQALSAEEIVRNINNIKEMVKEMTLASNSQAKYGEDIALEVENVRKQTEELNGSIETQTKEVEEVVSAISNVNRQIEKLK